MTRRQIGTGDAVWYHNMLADFVIQWRAGIFPVFVGQTDYAFNGAVYPLRVAPLYQHLAGLIDLLTGRHWSFFALQHATVVVCGFAGLMASYFTLARLAPDHRWTCCGLAVLYISCPGVLGTICTQDLYMTWMTVPILPFVTYHLVRSFDQDTVGAQIGLGAGLAALWLAHAPIALWMSMITVVIQVVRLLRVHRTRQAWLQAGAGGVVFAALAGYVFVSVASLKVPGVASTVSSGLTESERITAAIREVFPAMFLPVSDHARQLSDLQLGYAWWLVLFSGVVLACRPGASVIFRLLVAACIGLVFLLLPGTVTEWFWLHLPGAILRVTYYWPMHRFYLLLSTLLAAVALVAIRRQRPQPQKIVQVFLLFACLWSLWESRQFVRAVVERTASVEITQRTARPENRLLMYHSYGLLPEIPPYFSNGVMDYRAESRLLDTDSFQPLATHDPEPPHGMPPHGMPPHGMPMHGVIDANPGIVRFEPPLRLDPGKRYNLFFRFRDLAYRGILQLAGQTFFREYQLPESGEPLAFGTKVGNSRFLSLWTTSHRTEEVTVRFIPTGPGEKPSDYLDFGEYDLREASEAAIEITSLLPYRANVRLSHPAWLETSRVFIPGYKGMVNRQPVDLRRSPMGLAMIPVDPSSQLVELRYTGPGWLRLAYGFTLVGWFALVVASVGRAYGQSRARAFRPRPPRS